MTDISPIDPTLCIVTRFSFLGKSGWKSDFSQDAELLFERDRLNVRLNLLRRIHLASLASQTSKNFHLFVLTSADLPAWALTQLTHQCHEALGSDAVSIVAAPPGPARKYLRKFVSRRYGARAHAQIVLDDDDGLASDFLASVNDELTNFPVDTEWPKFLTFPEGYGLEHRNDGPDLLFRHRYPFINLGLTMITTPQLKNILSIDHKGMPKRRGFRSCRTDVPMFVRSVHHLNDSRVEVGPNWVPVTRPEAEPNFLQRFAWLRMRGTRETPFATN